MIERRNSLDERDIIFDIKRKLLVQEGSINKSIKDDFIR